MNDSKIPLKDIYVGQRRRKDYGDIQGLAKSFTDNGQITAITVKPAEGDEEALEEGYKGQPWILVAGGRRFAAALFAGWETIAAYNKGEMDPLQSRISELQENLDRKDMTFVEVANAKMEMLILRREQNPEITQAELAREIGETPANFSRDIAVAEALNKRPELAASASKKAVIRAAKTADHFEARIAREEPDYRANIEKRVVTADAREFLRGFADRSVNLHIPDLPYGIDHYSQGQKDGAETTLSEYDDSEGVTKDLFVELVPEFVRTLRTDGWLVCFQAEANYEYLKNLVKTCCCYHYDYEEQHTKTDQCFYLHVEEPRWIWYRPNSQNNPRFPEKSAKNMYEHILVARMPEARLMRPVENLLVYPAEYGSRIHAMQKPLDLLKDLISRFTLSGETVVDCCFGSGAHLAAGAALLRDVWGSDSNPALLAPARGYVSQYFSGVAKVARGDAVGDAGANDGASSHTADDQSLDEYEVMEDVEDTSYSADEEE